MIVHIALASVLAVVGDAFFAPRQPTFVRTAVVLDGCPVRHHVAGLGPTTKDWFPEQLNLKVLTQHSELVNPMEKDFDYGKEFQKLDVGELKQDLKALMTDSQEWWPADYGNYGPFFIRMTWHIAGTYRVYDGRGGGGTGNQRFAAINSWPDNANLDKARRLLWPIKQKYGKSVSWADLLMLVGNVAYESMGFPTMGFAFGRNDIWEAEEDINWGMEMEFGTNDKRYNEETSEEKPTLDKPLGADQMGWIYVNPEGWSGKPDPALSAKDIRETFARMAMNDEETVALTVGGHTFGKSHGNGDPSKVGNPPESAPIEMQGLGWKNDNGIGKAGDAVGSGIEGAWTKEPTKWDNDYLYNLFEYDWELTKSPAGSHQWKPKNGEAEGTVPDAHDPNTKHAPMMMTTDIALRADPTYEKIARRYYENPQELEEAFRKAWYKLIHRDMGPHQRMLGPDVPEPQPWQDPVPTADYPVIDESDIADLKKQIIRDSGLSITRLVTTAWASASTFRNSDKRGGANGARIRLAPMKDWEVNEPAELAKALEALENIQSKFNDGATGGKKVSLADLIVLGGTAAVEEAAMAAGFDDIEVPFAPGRNDVGQDMVDETSTEPMEPVADGVRNYFTPGLGVKPEEFLVDRAQLLTLTPPEMAVLVAGMRVLGVGAADTSAFTDNVGALTNDFFVNLLDMSYEWFEMGDNKYVCRDRKSGDKKWMGTRVDLVFGSNAQLRAIAEVYACDDAKEKFVKDFCKLFGKIMHLDRFDLDKYESELSADRVTGDGMRQFSYL